MFCEGSLLIGLKTIKRVRRKPSEKVIPDVKRIIPLAHCRTEDVVYRLGPWEQEGQKGQDLFLLQRHGELSSTVSRKKNPLNFY